MRAAVTFICLLGSILPTVPPAFSYTLPVPPEVTNELNVERDIVNIFPLRTGPVAHTLVLFGLELEYGPVITPIVSAYFLPAEQDTLGDLVKNRFQSGPYDIPIDSLENKFYSCNLLASCADSADNIYLALDATASQNSARYHIARFRYAAADSHLTPLFTMTRKPTAITIGVDGTIWVGSAFTYNPDSIFADTDAKLYHYSSAGALLPDSLRIPNPAGTGVQADMNVFGLASDPDGGLVAVTGSSTQDQLVRFAPGATTPQTRSIGATFSHGLAVDHTGAIYVSDGTRNAIAVYDLALTRHGVEGDSLVYIEDMNPRLIVLDAGCRLYAARPLNSFEHDIVHLYDLDADGDGLCDTWEVSRLRSGGDTLSMVPSPHVDHKDLYVEIDGMDSRQISALATDSLVAAFNRIPISNPDDVSGIALHVDRSEYGLDDPTWSRTSIDAAFDSFQEDHFAAALRESNLGLWKCRALVYHYAVSANAIRISGDTTLAGIAEGPGNQFAITDVHADEGDWRYEARTFMHELGHNLNLRHGGGDTINFKPNYHSVMNYSSHMYTKKQYAKPTAAKNAQDLFYLDYSPRRFNYLNESSLNEIVGIGGEIRFVPVTPRPKPGSPGKYLVTVVPERGSANFNPGDDDSILVNEVADINNLSVGLTGPGPGSPGQNLIPFRDDSLIHFPRRDGYGWRHTHLSGSPADEITTFEQDVLDNMILDCNGNGVHDSLDIADGAPDVDCNGIIDNYDIPKDSLVSLAIAACPAGDAESLVTEIPIGRWCAPPDSSGSVTVQFVRTADDIDSVWVWNNGVRWSAGDTLGSSYDASRRVVRLTMKAISGFGNIRSRVVVNGLRVYPDCVWHVRSFDGDYRSTGSVDSLDRAACIAAGGGGGGGGAPLARSHPTGGVVQSEGEGVGSLRWDFNHDGIVSVGDRFLLEAHLGHAIPRRLLGPNGGQWTTGQSKSVTWRRGWGDSSRVELYARNGGPSGSRILLAHAKPDTGALVLSVRAGLDTCTNCRIEIQHTAGTYKGGSLGIEVGSDQSDSAVTVVDGIAPNTSTLAVDWVSTHIIGLTWVAPGDDGASGRATQYDLRYSVYPNFGWGSGTQVSLAAPQQGGTGEARDVSGLMSCKRYYFRLKTRDEAGNWSAESGEVNGKTLGIGCGGGGGSMVADRGGSSSARSGPTWRQAEGVAAGVAITTENDSTWLALERSFGPIGTDMALYRLDSNPDSAGAGSADAFLYQQREGNSWRSLTVSEPPAAVTLIGVVGEMAGPVRLILPPCYPPVGFATAIAYSQDSLGVLELVGGSLDGSSLSLDPDSLAAAIGGLEVGDTLTLSYGRTAGDGTSIDDWWVLVDASNRANIRQVPHGRSIGGMQLPKSFALAQNHPNPFGGGTTIRFDLPVETKVTIEIFDLQGRRVQTLVNGRMPAGFQSVDWNRRSATGRLVGSGVYLYRMTTPSFSAKRKMVLLP